MRLRSITIIATLLAAPLSPSALAQLDAPLDPSTPPPAPLRESMPLQPGPAYVWSPGYWSLESGRYDWVGGAWMLPGYDYGLHFHIADRLDHRFGDHDRPHGEHLSVHAGHEGGHGR